MDSLELVNSLPFIGLVKGAYHYIIKEFDEAEKCFTKSGRSTAVFSAGAIGGLAEPSDAMFFGCVAGFISDYVLSLMRDRPVGIVECLNDLIVHIDGNNDIAVEAARRIGMTISGDSLIGKTGADVMKALSEHMEKNPCDSSQPRQDIATSSNALDTTLSEEAVDPLLHPEINRIDFLTLNQ